jgi:hypothetical protein
MIFWNMLSRVMKSAKVQIRNEFLRIGLKVSSTGTWSLQGLRLYKDLITIRETVVTDSTKQSDTGAQEYDTRR